MKKTVIIGIGSILRGDDGIGVRIADELSKKEMPDNVDVYNGDLSGIDLIKYFNDYESVSKLQRLLDKDPNEIVKEFSNLVESNLRVDFNTKNSFGASWI